MECLLPAPSGGVSEPARETRFTLTLELDHEASVWPIDRRGYDLELRDLSRLTVELGALLVQLRGEVVGVRDAASPPPDGMARSSVGAG